MNRWICRQFRREHPRFMLREPIRKQRGRPIGRKAESTATSRFQGSVGGTVGIANGCKLPSALFPGKNHLLFSRRLVHPCLPNRFYLYTLPPPSEQGQIQKKSSRL